MEYASHLITREEGLIKITYKHPWSYNILAKSDEVIPKCGAHDSVRADIDSSASSGGITIVDGEGN